MTKRRSAATTFPVGPSDMHVMTVVYQDPKTGRCTEQCKRCGSHFCGYGTANVWCMPTTEWLAAHPKDDGRWRNGPRSPLEPVRRTVSA